MAQIIRPEVWQEGIDDNRLLPGRYTLNIFTGKGVKIANNNEACRIYDIQISDYITDYDDRRLNGLSGKNTEGRDGWGASAYGVFQDVRFDSRVYTMGRHRSVAYRLFEEMQYSGGIGEWGTDTTSNVITTGESLMKVAQQISKAKEYWEKQVLGPDIDKYNLMAILNGHISGRWVQDDPDQICNCDGQWVAQPGMVQGEAIPPRFAAIHAIEWDDENIPLLLSTIETTWNNLMIPNENRVIILDPFYKIKLMYALTGNGIPATESAYADVRDGNFTRLMGWDFNFDIPTQYWPQLYLDDNLNVVHSADGKASYDKVLNSIAGGDNPDLILQNQLVAADRMNRPNFIRTVWNEETGKFEKVITNYPLGNPSTVPYLGEAIEVARGGAYDADGVNGAYTSQDDKRYPWSYPGAGYGLAEPTGPQGAIKRRQVIGAAIYKPAAQLSQEYSAMVTDEGRTRGKFTEMVMEVKYDAWVIESLAAGIMPIVDAEQNTSTWGVPVKMVDTVTTKVAGGNLDTSTTVANTVTASVEGTVATREQGTVNTNVTNTPSVRVIE